MCGKIKDVMTNDAIKKRLKIISDLQQDLNKVKALLDESLDSDMTYQEAKEHLKKIKSETSQRTTAVLESPAIKAMQEEMKQIRKDISENKEILAQVLADYYKDSGMLEIEDEEGNVKRIKFSVKLVSQNKE